MRLAAGSATVAAPGIGRVVGVTASAGRTQLAALVFVAGSLGAGIASADETKLAVALTAPASGAVYLAPAAIPLAATVAVLHGKEADRDKDTGKGKDNETDKEKGKAKALGKNQGKKDEHGNPHQRVVKVDFLQGATVIGTATAAPYAFEWTNVPAGNYVLTARATNAKGETVSSAPVTATVTVPVNMAPTVRLTSPADSASFTAPVDIPLSANAADTDGTITKVEFYNGSTLITTLTVAPYSVIWTGVPQGSYTLTAKATDNQGAESASAPVTVSVNAAVASTLYYIHTDHLNTPRLITNQAQQAVWRWDNTDPFGGNVPDENPGGLGNFACNLRLPGQYFDRETNNHYNYFRDYDPAIGRYIQSDPIGLEGGINTYAYALLNPLSFMDEWGLLTSITVWQPVGWGSSSAGHVSTNINGTTYSFAGNGMTIMPTPKYLAANQFRQGVSMTLALSPQQEAELERCLQANQGPYNVVSNNCGAPPQSCLALVGIHIGYAVTPVGMGSNILNSSALRGITFLPATQPVTGISAPWTR
jgi:RHS repeat-associated protein